MGRGHLARLALRIRGALAMIVGRTPPSCEWGKTAAGRDAFPFDLFGVLAGASTFQQYAANAPSKEK